MVTAQAHITGIFRYPVKSMRGESLPEAQVEDRGLEGDRDWGVCFPDGRVASGKTWKNFRRFDGLLTCTAVTRAGRVEVRTADGQVFTAGSPELDGYLAARGEPGVRLARENENGVPHHDIAALHLMSESTIKALGASLPEPQDAVVDRFRPNFLLGRELIETPEAAWVGRRIRIGEQVVLEVTELTERCVMTTLEQDGIPASKAVLRTLAAKFDTCLGVYARVLLTGEVRVGDPVVLMSD